MRYSLYVITNSDDLDPDQNRQSVGPDHGPCCLQRLSTDASNTREELKAYIKALARQYLYLLFY